MRRNQLHSASCLMFEYIVTILGAFSRAVPRSPELILDCYPSCRIKSSLELTRRAARWPVIVRPYEQGICCVLLVFVNVFKIWQVCVVSDGLLRFSFPLFLDVKALCYNNAPNRILLSRNTPNWIGTTIEYHQACRLTTIQEKHTAKPCCGLYGKTEM